MVASKKGLTLLAVFGLFAVFAPAASGATAPVPERIDWEAPIVAGGSGGTIQGLFDDDPTGLIPKTPFVQRYSLDQDHWEVWLCGSVSMSMNDVLSDLNAAAGDYFAAISGGVYEPVFTAGGSEPSDANCLSELIDGIYPTVGSPEGVLIVDSVTGSGGFASPGTICINNDPDCSYISSTFPGNRRYAVLGQPAVENWPSVIVHEIGHTLQWPHSNSGLAEYDNPIDLMSGNENTDGWSESEPYSTLSYSRFQSGWVSAADVVKASGSYQAVTLQPFNESGTQLFAIETAQPGRFFVLGTRTTSTYDPIPGAWQGVEVYEVDYYCDEGAFGGGICPGIYREHTQQPPSPGGLGHVLQPGESIVLEGLTVTVTGATATGYTLVADPNPGVDTEPSAPGTPTASVGDEQVALTWTSAGDGGSAILNYDLQIENRDAGGATTSDVGVTLAELVTGLSNGTTYRARVRAGNAIGDGPWSSWSADFAPGAVPAAPGTPTVSAGDGSLSASWAAPADIGGFIITNYEMQLNDQTSASNDYFDTGSLRSETLIDLSNGHSYRVRVRAENSIGVGPWSGWSASVITEGPPIPPAPPDTFIDDDGSIFEADIEWLAAAGITSGCNPPMNDRFCPNVSVTRGQMAAFLARALNLPAGDSTDFVDDDGSVFEASIEKLAAAGITLGCNPPTNDRFCPGDAVTREQMAAFLVRALGYTDAGEGDLFVDDDDSIFAASIDRLATAGVTRGCNTANDRFCPKDLVTRGQMAAFLHRALDS